MPMQVLDVRLGWANQNDQDKRADILVLVIFKLPESPYSYVASNLFNRWTGARTLPHSVRVNPEDPGKRDCDYTQENVPNPLHPDAVHNCVTPKVKESCELVARKWARNYKDQFGPGIPNAA